MSEASPLHAPLLTYMRNEKKYLGLLAEEDTDGNNTSNNFGRVSSHPFP
jgi:hypothetical protein